MRICHLPTWVKSTVDVIFINIFNMLVELLILIDKLHQWKNIIFFYPFKDLPGFMIFRSDFMWI